MQKVLRRSAYVHRRGKEKAKIQEHGKERHARSLFKRDMRQINIQRAEAIKSERSRRREHHELGPLSPWRTNFQHMLNADHFGTWQMQQLNYPEKPPKDRVRDVMFREGDRVVIIEGHESIKGRVGKIRDVKVEAEAVQIEGINRVEVQAPVTEADRKRGQPELQTSEMPIPFRSIRLVYPLPDPATGLPRDVIINNLVARRRHFDVYENKEVFERWLEPQHVRIPWPEKKEPNHVDEESDTLRIMTEEETFLPTLLGPPMPMGVIDELRNKFSKFRTRHDDEYIAQKEAQDAAAEAERQRKEAVISRGARNIARRRGSAVPRDRDNILPDDLAARIGQHMALREGISSKAQEAA